MEEEAQTVLHVGCGHRRKEHLPPGFKTVAWRELRYDINPDVGPDIVGSIVDMAVLPSATVDALYSSHVIEHLYTHEVPKAFAEFRRVLRPDGFAILTCPDLQSIAELVAAGRLLEPIYETGAGPIAPIDIMYGLRPAIERGNVFMAHRTGFTAQSLLDLLTGAGFVRVVTARTNTYALWAVATCGDVDTEEMTWLKQHFLPPPDMSHGMSTT
jgi:SAM-dependent methyltransferase